MTVRAKTVVIGKHISGRDMKWTKNPDGSLLMKGPAKNGRKTPKRK